MKYEASSGYQQIKDMHGEYYLTKLKNAYHRANILPLVKKACRNISNPRILEFGPGTGVMTDILLAEIPNVEYYAIDIDPVILERLKEKGDRVYPYLCRNYAELAKLELSDMDVVMGLDVWEHLPREELDDYTRYAIDMLNVGGIFIAQVPNWGCPFAPNTIFASDLTHVNFFTEISARQLLMRNGVPKDCITILPYKFPAGVVGIIRTMVRKVMFLYYRFCLLALGVQRVSIMTPNILMVAVKKSS